MSIINNSQQQDGSAIIDRSFPKNGLRSGEDVNFSLFSLLLSEIIQLEYNQAKGWDDFEHRLSLLGEQVGMRMHSIACFRDKIRRRESRLLNALYHVSQVYYKAWFGSAADSLEKSNESLNECTWNFL